MLKKTKIKLISILATAFATLSAFAIGLGQTANRAYAQSGEIFEMENGASLKISEDGGIRFRVKMDESQMLYITDNDDVTLHFLVAPHEFYNAVPYANGTFDYYNGLSKKKVINVDETKIYKEDGYYWANGCVTNINEVNRYLDYTFLAYTYDAQTDVIDYAGVEIGGDIIQETHELDYKLSNVRGNLVDILSQAVVYDGGDANYADSVFNCSAYAEWFGTEEYPIQINNLAMYNSLVNKVNAGEDFSAYNISVLDTVPMDGRTELSEGKTLAADTSYMVKFLNDDGSLYKKFIVKNGETLAIPKNPAKASSAQYAYTFIGWDVNSDGAADAVETNVQKSVTYTALYTATTNQYKVTFDAQGGTGGLESVTVDYGTSLSEFYKMKYLPADSGFLFDSWRYNGEKIDENAIVTGDMELVAYYKRVDGTEVAESPVNGDFYQAFLEIPVDAEVGTTVMIEMDILVTGKIVSSGVDTASEYYNQWATSSIRWVDSVYVTDGENTEGRVNSKPVVVPFERMQQSQGEWMRICFFAEVRNFPVLRDATGWAGAEMSGENAVYLFAYKFKSAASFNYQNVIVTKAPNAMPMPTGTQKTKPDKFYQSAVGIPADLSVGTEVQIEMDIFVTGTTNEYSYISWIDTVWGDNAVHEEIKLVTSESISANAGKWIHLAFYASVRDFDALRRDASYPTIDVSSVGTGVFIMAANFLSNNSFIYKNVTMTVISSVPDGTQKTSNANGYYQAAVGLPVEYEEGTPVIVEMDVYITGTYDKWSDGILWIDEVYTKDGGEIHNNSIKIVDVATMDANAGQWIHVEFEATVRNFPVLRTSGQYATIDVSSYGNAVYLFAKGFKSASSFKYKNVSVRLSGEDESEVPAIEGTAMPTGTQKTNPDEFYQSAVGLSADLAVGTLAKVEMDVYVTGTTNEYSYISWIDTVWGDNAVHEEIKLVTSEAISVNAGKWIHLVFYAFVRDFDALRRDASYPTIDVSSVGTGVFIMAANFLSADTFSYRNVVISADKKTVGVAMPAGTEKTSGANGYHQAFVGLPTDYEVGTFVNVTMEIYVTGTFDSYSSIHWVDTIYSNNGANKRPMVVSYNEMSANIGKWIAVSFDAYVRDFDSLCLGNGYPLVDVSEAGNGVFLFACQFKSDASFNYRNARVTAYDAVPNGTEKTSNANGYYQAFVGLPVSVPAGTSVSVEMEVYITGGYDQYSGGIRWVDTVWSTAGGETNSIPTIVSIATMDENAGQWITVAFEATVRDFEVLRANSAYAAVDLYDVGNAVFLFAKDFKSEASFVYRNVVITLNGENVSTGEFAPQEYVSNGHQIANYTIVVSDDADKSTQYAATILQKQLRKALGYDVKVVTDATAETDLEIVLGATNRNAGADINYVALGEEGFIVKNVENKLVIAGNERGVLYGVYAYLEALGFRFYTADVEKIPSAEAIFVPASIELSWNPTFTYREVMYEMTWDAEWAVSQRINSDFMRNELKNDARYGGFEGYVGGDTWMVHTFSKLLPEGVLDTNPEYFAYVDGKRIAKTSKGLYTQPCLTNEGAYQYILKSALAKIASDRKANVISISENDSEVYCHCDACEASYAQYGVSGTYFRFINRIAGDIAKVYPDVMVDTLSYEMSKEAPENLKLADNVIVRVCPRMCNFCTNPNKCENLAKDQQRVRDFVAICDNVYIWMYPINWGNLYAALPNYDEMCYQVNFFAQAGVKGIYAEGYSKENPEFGELKAYLMAKLLQNPTMSKAEYEYHYNDFLQGYYGDAAKYIAKYHQITEEMMDKKMETAHYENYFTAADNFDFAWNSATNSYDMTNINKINALWAQALNAVEEGSAEWHHVKKSMIHWTYIELYNTMDNRYKYGTSEEKAELVARNKALYNDIVYYGTLRIYDNSHDLQPITDFTKSPHKDKGNWFDQRTTLEETLGGIFGV